MLKLNTSLVISSLFLCFCGWYYSLEQSLTTLCLQIYMRKGFGKLNPFLFYFSESYGFTANIRFTFKCLIIRNPGLTVLWTLLSTVLILGYILRVFEIQYYRAIGFIDFDDYFQSLWVIVITITTVGFGDLVAFSYFGRVIIMLTAFWGAFLISLLIFSVGKIFELTRSQKKAMHHLFLTRKAASSITSAMRFFLAKSK